MKFVGITNPYDLKFETDLINRLFLDGLEELHIHKPEYSKSQMEDFIKKIDSRFYNRILVHNYFQLVKKYSLKGILIDTNWLKNSLMNFVLHKILINKECKVYLTINHYNQIEKYQDKVDALMLGPIFVKASQVQSHSGFDFEKLRKKVANSSVPVIAMGGIDETNFGEIQNIGFSNIALQSAIWKAPEPIVAYKNMVDFSENPYKAVKLKVV